MCYRKVNWQQRIAVVVQVSKLSRTSCGAAAASEPVCERASERVKVIKILDPSERQSMLKYLTHKLRTHTIDDDIKVCCCSEL